MRACKDCQWYEAGDYQYVGNCRWNPAYDHVLSDHWCAQFHRKETEEGEGKDPNA